jgi:hypothetical protein
MEQFHTSTQSVTFHTTQYVYAAHIDSLSTIDKMYDAMNESSVPCKRVCVEDDEDGYEDDDIVAVVDASPPMKRERAKKNTPNTLRGIAKRFIDLLRDNADITIGQVCDGERVRGARARRLHLTWT